MNLKNAEVDRLIDQIVRVTGESKTEAVRRALSERALRLGQRAGLVSRGARILEFLESEVWPLLPQGREDDGRDPEDDARGAPRPLFW